MSSDGVSYKETIQLPQTTFPMKGNLVQREPERLEKWEQAGVYHAAVARRNQLPVTKRSEGLSSITVVPGGTLWVSHTLPPTVELAPMMVSPPRIVAPA